MTAGIYNFTIEQGVTFTQSISVLDSAGEVMDLTGCTARLQVRGVPADSSTLLSLTTENGGLTISGSLGIINILISATDTAAMTADRGFYDLKIITGGVPKRLLQGTITISKEVTR